jgi:hypothetical protein
VAVAAAVIDVVLGPVFERNSKTFDGFSEIDRGLADDVRRVQWVLAEGGMASPASSSVSIR